MVHMDFCFADCVKSFDHVTSLSNSYWLSVCAAMKCHIFLNPILCTQLSVVLKRIFFPGSWVQSLISLSHNDIIHIFKIKTTTIQFSSMYHWRGLAYHWWHMCTTIRESVIYSADYYLEMVFSVQDEESYLITDLPAVTAPLKYKWLYLLEGLFLTILKLETLEFRDYKWCLWSAAMKLG